MEHFTRRALTAFGKFNGIDTALFQHDAEWELLDAYERIGRTDVEIAELNRLADLV